MPERLDRVAISTSHDVIELSWASRDSLLHEIRNLGENAKPIRTAFKAVSGSRPVELSRSEQTTLFSTIEVWAHSVTVEALPPGIWRLRWALASQRRPAHGIALAGVNSIPVRGLAAAVNRSAAWGFAAGIPRDCECVTGSA